MDTEQREKLNQILDHLKENLDSPNWLSGALVALSSLLIHTSGNIAQAQFEENAVALRYLDSAGEKKVSVAEADKRGIQETFNRYKQSTLEREAIVETIMAIKKRLDYLAIDYRHS